LWAIGGVSVAEGAFSRNGPETQQTSPVSRRSAVALEAPFGPARANKAHERLAEGHVVGKINLAVHDRAI
jgi:hypothetical protein